MSISRNIVISFVAVVSACANPLNQATSERYSDSCAQAEQDGRLTVAEEACYRAVVNVDWGNLGDVEKSQKLYNLARIKRQLRKFDEAGKLYKDSLSIEENLPHLSNEKIGRRLAELAITFSQEKKYREGEPYVERLFILADTYQGIEKKTVAAIFYVYSQELSSISTAEVRNKFERKAIAMGFDPKSYKQ